MFYGSQQSSRNIGSSLIDKDRITSQFFFEEFQVQGKQLQDQRNEEIKNLVKDSKIENPATYKDEHRISSNKVYQTLYLEKDCYPALQQLFKFSMLVPPSTANVEQNTCTVINETKQPFKNRKPSQAHGTGSNRSDWFNDAT